MSAITGLLFYAVLQDKPDKGTFYKAREIPLVAMATWQVATLSPPQLFSSDLPPSLSKMSKDPQTAREEKHQELFKLAVFEVKGNTVYCSLAITPHSLGSS